MRETDPSVEVCCPECLGALPASGDRASALREHGCVYCGAPLDDGMSGPADRPD